MTPVVPRRRDLIRSACWAVVIAAVRNLTFLDRGERKHLRFRLLARVKAKDSVLGYLTAFTMQDDL